MNLSAARGNLGGAFAFATRSGSLSACTVVLVCLLTGPWLTGCAAPAAKGRCVELSRTNSILLARCLMDLGPSVSEADAIEVATVACFRPLELAADYRLTRPPTWHNFLVNLGVRKRGLCYQWADDLAEALESTGPRSLHIRRGISRPGTWWEHSCVVITATDQPFEEGLVLDGWRNSGILYWGKVKLDKYQWQETVLAPNLQGN